MPHRPSSVIRGLIKKLSPPQTRQQNESKSQLNEAVRLNGEAFCKRGGVGVHFSRGLNSSAKGFSVLFSWPWHKCTRHWFVKCILPACKRRWYKFAFQRVRNSVRICSVVLASSRTNKSVRRPEIISAAAERKAFGTVVLYESKSDRLVAVRIEQNAVHVLTKDCNCRIVWVT